MRDKLMHIRLAANQYNDVREMAKGRGQSAVELVRQLIADGMRRLIMDKEIRR